MKLKNTIAIGAVAGLMCLRAIAQVTVSTTATTATYIEPYNVVEDSSGNIFISDSANDRIIRIDATTTAASVLAGVTGAQGATDGAASGPNPAEFFNPQGLLVVSIGGTNGLLVADSGNNLIRFVRFSDGDVTTLAGQSPVKNGTTNELGANATFNDPVGLAQDANGNVYIADEFQNAIRVINLQDPLFGVTNLVFLDGTTFQHPNAVALVGTNELWVADSQNNSVKLITLATPTTGSLTTYVGGNSRSAVGTADNPFGPSARFDKPSGLLWIPSVGLIISDTGNNSLRLATYDPAYGVNNYAVSTYAGVPGLSGAANGSALSATFNQPEGLCLDPNNGAFLVADLGNNAIRSLQYTAPLPHVPSGLMATANYGATTLTWNPSLNATNYNVKRSQTSTGQYVVVGNTSGTNFVDITVVSGQTYYYVVSALNAGGESANSSAVSVTAPTPPLDDPQGIAFDGLHNSLFIADYASSSVQLLNLNNNSTTTFQTSTAGLQNPVSVLLDTNDDVYVLNQGTLGNGFILKFDISGNAYGPIVTGLKQPTAFTMDGYGTLFVAEQTGSILAFGTGISNLVTTIPNANVSLQGIALFDDGTIAVSDAGNQVIWTVNPITKLVTQLTGQLGTSGTAVGAASFASLSQPHQLARVAGDQIVAADYGNNRLVLIQRDGTVATNQLNSSVGDIWFGQAGDPIASGNPRFISMASPCGVAVGNAGEIFASENYYNDIRGLTGTGLTTPTLNPVVPVPYFAAPQGLAFDNLNNSVFIADFANNAVEQLDLNNDSTTTFLTSADNILRPASVLVDPNNNVYVLNQNAGANGSILEFDPYGNLLATNLTGLSQPTAFTMDGSGNIFITELGGAIKVLFPSGAMNTVVTLGNNAQLQGIAAFDDGVLAVSDSANQVIWTVNPTTKQVSQFTGQLGATGTTLGAANVALLNQPHQLARVGNNQLLIADYGNNRLVTANRSGAITNVLASANSQLWLGRPTDPAPGTTVAMMGPAGVAVSASGLVFDSEPADALIRGLTAAEIAPPTTPPIVNLPLFAAPQGLAFDSVDNFLFIADSANSTVQRLNLNNNSTVTFLSQTNGLLNPASVLLDTNSRLYVLNQNAGTNGSILKFGLTGNAFGPIVSGLHHPTAFTMDGVGTLFVVEQAGNIRAFGTGISNLVATITNANVSLQGIALFDDGTIAVSDAGNQVIWTVNPITKFVSQLTGQLGASGAAVGVASFASLAQPQQLLRVGGNQIVAADTGNNRLVLIQRDGTVITNNPTYQLNSSVGNIWFGQAGDPVASGSPRFVPMVAPVGLALGNGGEIFASETYYADIRGLTGTGITSPTFNPGVSLPYFGAPQGLAFDNLDNSVFIADFANNAVEQLDLNDNTTTTFLTPADGILHPASVLVDTNNNVYVLNQNAGNNGSILKFDPFGNVLATNLTGLNQPTAFTMDGNGNIFITELAGTIKVLLPSGAMNKLVTLGNNAQLQGIAAFDDGVLAVSDSANQVIWTVNPTTKQVSQLTGQLGTTGTTLGAANVALLNQPHQLARVGNNQLLIADYGNNRLVTATRSGAITIVLASANSQLWLGRSTDPAAGTTVAMMGPAGVAVSAAGLVFDSEPAAALIRGLTATVSAPPATPPIVSLPLFGAPQGLAFDSVDNYLFIADYANNAVQRLNLDNNSTATFLTPATGILHPVSVVMDTNNNVYVLNQNSGTNGSILKFNVVGNAFGPIVTGLNQPTAFTMDGYGTFYVTEQAGNVRAFGAGISNLVATLPNANVSLQGIALFDDGTIAVSDAGSNVLWTINPITKVITQLTGQLGTNGAVGVAGFANLAQPQQLVRVGGNQIIAADSGNNRLVLIQRDGTVVTNNASYQLNSSVGNIWFGQAGDPVAGGSPRFVPMVSPVGLAVGNGGEIFASETYYDDIRGLTGTGIASPTFNPEVPLPYYAAPAGIGLNNEGTILYVTDPTHNTVSALNLANNQTTVFLNSNRHLAAPVDVASDSSDNVYVLNQGTGTNGFVLEYDRFGNLLSTNATGLPLPTAMTFDNSGNILVAEQAGAVQEFAAGASNPVATLATVVSAGVQLQGIALFNDGTIVLSDAGNHVLWQLDPVTKNASLFTGQLDSPGTTFGSTSFAQLNQPHQLKLAGNNSLVAADSGNNRLVLIARSGAITNALDSTTATVWFGLSGDPAAAGSAEFVPMVSPVGLAIGAAGGVFASETYYHDIREILGTSVTQPTSGGNTGGTGTNAIVVSPPVISPNSGYYPMGQTILVQSSASQVFYTTDGTDPTTNSLLVSLTNNVGYLYWYNSTNDLTSLRLKAFLNGTNASATTAGQLVASANIGVPSDFNPELYAGIGSTVVIPVVCNLAADQQIQSYQYRLEIAPLNSSNTPVISALDISPGIDFIPLVTAAQNGVTATSNVEAYSLGVTNGLTSYAVGAGTHILFHGYAVVNMLEVQIPANANPGDTYAVNVLYPSATADAYNDPVPLTPMPTTTIIVTNIPYTVGDSASTTRTWYNAGTFGDGNLDNSDVNQAFYAASGLRVPFAFSDAFNAMDAFPLDTDGSVGGDGQIRFLDWVTILGRSLRLDPDNWAREWSAGGNLIDFSTNLVVSHARTTSAPKATPKASSPWPWYRQVLLGLDSVGNVAPNATVAVPIYAQLADGSSLSGLQFRAVVTPQNDAPALTTAPQLATASGVASPLLTQSFNSGETAFGWSLDSFNYLSRSSNFLGWITFTVPTNALAGQTYQVSLLNADGAPNATNQYDFETRSATVAVNAAAPPATICSDEWKLHFFGSTTNPAAADNADPDGDGVPNWMEFLAGTDPTSALSKLRLTGALATAGKSQTQMQLNWLTAPGRAYAVQWNANLNNPRTWNTLSTISGTGYSTNCPDPGFNSTARFYRLQLLP